MDTKLAHLVHLSYNQYSGRIKKCTEKTAILIVGAHLAKCLTGYSTIDTEGAHRAVDQLGAFLQNLDQ
jgi:hypothetical protein